MRLLPILAVSLLMTGCATTTFKPWSNDSVYQGTGGSVRNVDGIDIWEHGAPDRPYQIIGIIDSGTPITGGAFLLYNLVSMDSNILATAKEHGADGIIIIENTQKPVGQSSSGSPLLSLKEVVAAIKYVAPKSKVLEPGQLL